jgi:starch phosphorylase
VLTIGFARRASAYKRADLLVTDLERLRAIVQRAERLQVVFAGKAHPRDDQGKRMIERVFQARDALRHDVPVAYLEDYDLAIGGLVTAGADVWLNTPHAPTTSSSETSCRSSTGIAAGSSISCVTRSR